MKWFPTPPEISQSQAGFIFDAVMAGSQAAVGMNNSDEAAAQQYRDGFDRLKQRAIEDPLVREVIEECYQFGWNFCARDKEKEVKAQRREEERAQAALRAQIWFDRKLFKELARDLGRLSIKWVPVTEETSRTFDDVAVAVNRLSDAVLAARTKWQEDNRVDLETLED
jgi:hypothetical protein